jgi:hypothetical protein
MPVNRLLCFALGAVALYAVQATTGRLVPGGAMRRK